VKAFHTIVAGLGAMGSAALYHLATSGVKVAGFDRFAPPHAMGSSHGETRMIREAYYENPRYVPLVRRAYELWHELSAASGETMIVETGGIYAGPPDGELVPGMLRAAREHGIDIVELSHPDASREFPWLHFEKSWQIAREPRAGFVYPEKCIAAHLQLAANKGATLHTSEPVQSWEASGDGVTVRTQRGEYSAEKLILATGAWMIDTLSGLGIETVVERQPLFWFKPNTTAGRPSAVWALEFKHAKLLYGFPGTKAGVKVAIHYGGVQRTRPDEIDRTLHDKDVQLLRRHAGKYLPNLLGELTKAEVCMYTNTPDLHFIFDAHPQHNNVLVVSACSGHGFKFSSAIGEAAAQWSRDGAPRADMSLFTLARFNAL
jgi:sarcosine oxidase